MSPLEWPYLAEDHVRFSGTEQGRVAEDDLFATYDRIGLNPKFHEVAFMGWRPTKPARLSVRGGPEDRELDVRPMLWSSAVTAEGSLRYVGTTRVIGVFDWECYELSRNGQTVASLHVREDGPAVPLAKDSPRYPRPAAVISSDDGAWLRRHREADELRASLTIDTAFDPGASFRNVIGELGSGQREILITSHHDTMYDAPGANDNGSGVEAVLRLAKRLQTADRLLEEYLFKVCSFGGEEWMLAGSEAYAAEREQNGTLEGIDLVINIDCVGRGDYFWPWVTDDTASFLDAAMPGAFDYEVRVLNPPLFGDHTPFERRGVPPVMLIWWPYAEYHSPGDTWDKIDESLIDRTVDIATGVIESHSRS
jgi:hypothetical protein